MIKDELFERSPIRCFEKATGGIKAGELGLLTSKKGLGKTSVLVQFGVDTLLQDKQVIHVSFDQQSANVITWYQDIFTEIAKKKNISNISELVTDLVRKRIILNFHQDAMALPHIVTTLEVVNVHARRQNAGIREMRTHRKENGSYQLQFQADIGGLHSKKRRQRFLEGLTSEPIISSIHLAARREEEPAQ